MKNLILITLSLFCIFTSCVEDFDELNDTNQRYMTFTFNADKLLGDVLYYEDNYSLGTVDNLDDDYRLRITAYCYDLNDSLIYTDRLISKQMESNSIKIRHLFKETTYQFVFVADIVKHDLYVDFYETWFQMGTGNWNDFYIYADNREDNALHNVMGFSSFREQPSNQEVEIDFKPITYNGYCVFDNVDSVDRLSGYVAYCSSFKLRNLQWLRLNSLAYSFDYSNAKDRVIVKPVSLSYADSIISVKLRTTTVYGIDSVYIDIYNKDRRPFVATFDCSKQELTNCEFY